MSEPFYSAFGGSGTMFAGRPPVFRPDLDVAGAVGMSGPQGMMLNMALQPLVSQMVGPGYVPGQFNPTVNFYDQMRAKSQIAAQQQAMRAGAQVDRTAYFEMLRGMSALTGTRFGVREARAANAMADDLSAMAPYIAPLMPDMFDRLHGSRGSALLMSQMMSAGARQAIDPVTGLRGMSADSVNTLTRGLYDQMYGPTADVAGMRGLTAGRTGQLYDEMQRRGMMGGGSRDELLRDVSRQTGTAVDQLTNLPDLDSRLRTADIARTKDRLTSMAGAVSAMQDLFGEMGQADAPLPQLLNAIEALTQGGLSNMRPEKVEQMVRTASNVARSAGASLESLFQLSASMTGRTDALGLDRTFATRAAVGGLSFADAFGRTMGGVRGFGIMGKDQMAMLGAQLEANAAASPAANRLASVIRLGEELNAFDIKGDSDAARLYRAAKAGRDEFTDAAGNRRSVAMPASGPGGLLELLTASGVRGDLYERVLAQTGMNQGTLAQNEQLVRTIRRSQGSLDIQPRLAQQFGLAFASIGGDKATKDALQAAAVEASDFLLDVDKEQFQRYADRNYTDVVDRVEKSLTGRGVAVDANMRKRLEQEVRLAAGQIDEASRLDPGTRRYGGAPNMLLANNRRTLREAEFGVREAEVEAGLQTSLSRVGRSSPIQRMADLLRTAGPGTTVQEVIAKSFGYQPAADVQAAIAGPLGQVKAELDALNALDPVKDKSRVQTLLAQVAVGGPMAAQAQMELNKVGERYGGASPQDIARMDVRDLRIAATARTTTLVDRAVPELQKALRNAGMVTSRMSGKEANETLKLMDLGHRSSLDRSRSLAETVLMDETAMTSMGEEGLTTVRSLMDSSQRLKELAKQLTGGDVEKLLKGDYAASPEKKAEVERLKRQSADSVTAIGKALGEGKDQSGGWSDEYRKKVGQYRDDLKKSGDQALVELLGLTGRADVLDRGKMAEIAKSAQGTDVLQNALVQARELKDRSGGRQDEYVKLLRDRGGVMSLLADAAEGKALPPELLADEVSKQARQEKAKEATTVAFAPGYRLEASGRIDLVTNEANLVLKAPNP